MSRHLKIFTDGACSGNPGPAGIGIVIYEDGAKICEIGKPIGDATNNIAEYSALIYALQEAVKLKATHLDVYTDSELMHRQIQGIYKVKNERIKFLFDQVNQLKAHFEEFKISHVLRGKNKEADCLASSSLKKKQPEMAALPFEHGGEESPSSTG